MLLGSPWHSRVQLGTASRRKWRQVCSNQVKKLCPTLQIGCQALCRVPHPKDMNRVVQEHQYTLTLRHVLVGQSQLAVVRRSPKRWRVGCKVSLQEDICQCCWKGAHQLAQLCSRIPKHVPHENSAGW